MENKAIRIGTGTMRDFGVVFSTFWTSKSTKSMSDDAKMLAVYLLTGPHSNIIGCYRLPDGYICEDMRWTAERVYKGFNELFNNGFATHDKDTEFVFIYKYLKWNPLENPNQIIAAMKIFKQIPDESPIKNLISTSLREYTRKNLKGYETLPIPFTNPSNTHDLARSCSIIKECDISSYHKDSASEEKCLISSTCQPLSNPSETVSKPGPGTGPGTGPEDIPFFKKSKNVNPPPFSNSPLFCAELAANDAAPPRGSVAEPEEICVCILPLNDQTAFRVLESQVAKWEGLYPAVDVRQELRNMTGWLDANPKRRKTRNGALRFVNAWLERSQNRGGNGQDRAPAKMEGTAVTLQNRKPTSDEVVLNNALITAKILEKRYGKSVEVIAPGVVASGEITSH